MLIIYLPQRARCRGKRKVWQKRQTFINIHSCRGLAEQLPSWEHGKICQTDKTGQPNRCHFYIILSDYSKFRTKLWLLTFKNPYESNPLRSTETPLPVSKENQWYSSSFILRGAYSCHKIDFSLPLPLSICLSHPLHPLLLSIHLSLLNLPIYSAFPQSISLCLFCYHLSLFSFLNLSLSLLHISVSQFIKMLHLDPFSARSKLESISSALWRSICLSFLCLPQQRD